MYEGKYEMVCQTGLSEVDFTTRSGRPPIYAGLLFATIYLTNCSAVALVLVHSVITSLVAYVGYRIVKAGTGRQGVALLSLWVLFVFPMNFLKSGTVDEAPLMLVFLLFGVYALGRYLRDNSRAGMLVLSGVMLGLSTMTRTQTLPIAFGVGLFLALRRLSWQNWKMASLFALVYLTVLAPWMGRNYVIYGRYSMEAGTGGRLFLVTQSEDFIRSFPYESIDVIERRYIRSYVASHQHLQELDTVSLGREFTRLARAEALNHPLKYARAFITRLKVFVPYRYYPVMHSPNRDVLYVSWYAASLLLFFWSAVRWRPSKPESKLLLIAIIGWILPAFICFMGSRHFYPFIVLMIVFSFAAYPWRSSPETAGPCDTRLPSEV
jgi:4-amino-4-deoxy-L-arabinose transferase-like glycosyltransferase